MKKLHLRFYEELNDFLPANKSKKRVEHPFIDRTTVKDLIESLGVPHTEVDLILVNQKSVGFDYLVDDCDDISVYPVFESFDISGVQHLRPTPLRIPKFILDVHLGKLAKYMRMLGLDTLYSNSYNDEEIIKISLKEKRTILTKDRGILKRNEVTHGYWVRSTNSEKQIAEIIERFDLKQSVSQFSRCLECNKLLTKIKKENIIDRIPPKVRAQHEDYYICKECDRIYWAGSHYDKMKSLIKKILDK
ncbi:MAG: twitching motility protein PilT [Ignavibacteria bacterium RBG_13_36_8]|nr:MAG: twitching motility protein PilT [Ignavibacteria bacterium RBG_13_36_8]